MQKYLSLIALLGTITLAVIFLQNGVLNTQPDTVNYVDQIRYYNNEKEMATTTVLRSFKPFYGIVGASVVPPFSEKQSILFINILFYFSLLFISFFFFKELGFENKISFIGTTWIATSYPLLKYGLALLTDISGWFFSIVVITTFLLGIRKKNNNVLLLASVLAFIGSLCKETGVLGLVFISAYFILHALRTKEFIFIKKLLLSVVPFIILQALFIFSLFYKSSTHESFLGWFLFTKKEVGYALHTLYYFTFVELSTFNMLWTYATFSMYKIIKNKNFSFEKSITWISLFVAILPPLIWPIFMTRILFSGYLFIIPLSLLGLHFIMKKSNNTLLLTTLAILPILTSFILFIAANGGSLFDVLKKLL